MASMQSERGDTRGARAGAPAAAAPASFGRVGELLIERPPRGANRCAEGIAGAPARGLAAIGTPADGFRETGCCRDAEGARRDR